MSKKAGLGRGIGALIPTGPAPAERATAEEAEASPIRTAPAQHRTRRPAKPGSRPVDVFFSGEEDEDVELRQIPGASLAAIAPTDIRPNANQPRTVFDEDDLAELEHSIREFGVLQPIVVRPVAAGDDGTHYELIMGERRWRASQRAGLEAIPAVVKETPDDAMLRDALLENLHRAQLNPLEEASAYQQLMEDFAITQEELSKRIGRSRPQISNTIRLLKLPQSIQSRVASGVLSAGHARAILSLPTPEAMDQLAAKIVNEDLSVRAAEAAAGLVQTRSPRRTPTKGAVQHGLDEIARRLEDRLDTRVRIALGRSKGQLTIDFATVADLGRILAELGEQGFDGPTPTA
ncbi:ParB/RepB/Spo0J family partition protein [Agrococcus sp. Marseille-Q4369]|uniref:ParB/RepB/Spo0J family partition protein n=1 Tax=Agrococcus sp. Marseille-Q4369 TaxID=2810513 RepID=UPI001B8B0CC8|nr:ParB/RepB/Spo0J family partition protein [Agrococcus sp. Marseille-Q4369]QUW17985.1 ParB/RepB/Spo0J family partition protein [Agrococcus sp. Marseille-Q4369]